MAQDLKELLERIRLRLDESFVGIGAQVADLPAVDLAELLNQLTLVEAATVMSMLPIARAVELCDQPTMRRRAAILAQLEPSRVADILTGLAADERTDIVQKMGVHLRHRILPKLSPEIRTELEDLLQYPDHTAGGIMTTEFVRLDPGIRVGEALKRIRSVAREKESIYACYVLDQATDKLLGAVSLRDLVMAEFEAPLSKVMKLKPVTVNALDDQEVVAKKISKYNLLAVPVLEKDGSVVGFVTVDDVIDVLIQEGTEDILRMGAIEPGALDKPYMQTALPVMIRKRAGWLVILFLGEMLTATAMGFFEKEIEKAVVLALFVPLIISSGGNSGSQASTLVIRALALGEVTLRDWWRVMRREVISGLGLGLDPRFDWIPAYNSVVSLFEYLRNPLDAGGPDGWGGVDWYRFMGHARRFDVAVRAAATGLRPGDILGALRGYAGRRNRAGDVFSVAVLFLSGTLL